MKIDNLTIKNIEGITTEDISGLGTAATHPTTDFATAAQGTKADSALQTVPTASPTVLGGIKIGTGLTIDGAGVVTASSSIPKTVAVAEWVETVKQIALASSTVFPIAPYSVADVLGE